MDRSFYPWNLQTFLGAAHPHPVRHLPHLHYPSVHLAPFTTPGHYVPVTDCPRFTRLPPPHPTPTCTHIALATPPTTAFAGFGFTRTYGCLRVATHTHTAPLGLICWTLRQTRAGALRKHRCCVVAGAATVCNGRCAHGTLRLALVFADRLPVRVTLRAGGPLQTDNASPLPQQPRALLAALYCTRTY